MSKIANAFQNGKAFIPFLTAGDPSLEWTETFLLEMVRAGADLIEIGIPFSDPIAEGVVIQEANLRALSAGTTPEKIFQMVASVRQKTDIPLVFLTYINPVFNYGYEKFLARCAELGVDGLILPDLPYEEKGEIVYAAKRHGVDIISLIAPTSEQRIGKIASEATGYLYIVSSMGVTGVRSEIRTDLPAILKVVRENSTIPAAVGFGINTPQQAYEISRYADGVIVGSAIVRIIEKYGSEAAPHVYEYVKTMKEAMRRD
ncbi:MAG: tryptophan synthase subunit alpha [Planctomycetia bacterium]|nr:tryptophan synthase subunit alpha [Planctomycetia bacterium]